MIVVCAAILGASVVILGGCYTICVAFPGALCCTVVPGGECGMCYYSIPGASAIIPASELYCNVP